MCKALLKAFLRLLFKGYYSVLKACLRTHKVLLKAVLRLCLKPFFQAISLKAFLRPFKGYVSRLSIKAICLRLCLRAPMLV